MPDAGSGNVVGIFRDQHDEKAGPDAGIFCHWQGQFTCRLEPADDPLRGPCNFSGVGQAKYLQRWFVGLQLRLFRDLRQK